MKRQAVYGVGNGINGREAAMQATQHALDQLGPVRPALALVFASQEFQISEVLTGLASLLGETPLWGFSTLKPVTGEGDQPRSVLVALIAGSDYHAAVQWYPHYAQDSAGVARQLLQHLRSDLTQPHDLLLAADGINGSLDPVCTALGSLPLKIAGGMASGDASFGKTYQVGKNQAGPGGLSAAALGGRLCLGLGMAHGWQDLGVHFRATRAREVWLHALDGAPAAEVYARYFGYSARDWALPPLAEMARLYPLAVEFPACEPAPLAPPPEPAGLCLRSALRVEADGSLRLSGAVPEGAVVRLMTGDPDACLRAARAAAAQALQSLGGARPLLALALVDSAWDLLFTTRPNAVAKALKSVLGGVPLVGAYTHGQIAREAAHAPVLHNQNLALVIVGER